MGVGEGGVSYVYVCLKGRRRDFAILRYFATGQAKKT